MESIGINMRVSDLVSDGYEGNWIKKSVGKVGNKVGGFWVGGCYIYCNVLSGFCYFDSGYCGVLFVVI